MQDDAATAPAGTPATDPTEQPAGQPVGPPVPGWTPRQLPRRTPVVGRWVRADPLGLGHGRALLAALCGEADEPLWTYRPTRRPETEEELRELVLRPLLERPDATTWVFSPTGGAVAGMATFFPCVTTTGVVEISSVLWARSMQRTTAATEAVHLMLRHVFDDLGYRRVEWKCDSLNAPSRRAAERLGFTFEGRFRQHMVVKGRSRDTDWFSITDGEWPAVRVRHERWLEPGNFDGDGRQVTPL